MFFFFFSPQPVPDVSSDGVDATESHKEADFSAFPEVSDCLFNLPFIKRI